MDRVVLAEDLDLAGQRVRSHVLEAEVEGRWREVSRGATIGYRRVHAFGPVSTQRLRLRILEVDDEPVLAHMAAHDSGRP